MRHTRGTPFFESFLELDFEVLDERATYGFGHDGLVVSEQQFDPLFRRKRGRRRRLVWVGFEFGHDALSQCLTPFRFCDELSASARLETRMFARLF